MPIKTVDTYQIDLSLQQSDDTKRNIANLKSSFSDMTKSMADLADEYAAMVKTEGDHSAEAKEYNKLLNDRLKSLEKENDQLIQAGTEEGKRNRARMKELQAEQGRRKLEKKELEELKRLEKSVLDISEEELAIRVKKNKSDRIGVRMALENAKALQKEEKVRRSIRQLAADGWKQAKQSLKAQLEYIKALKTTEGRLKAVNKLKAGGAKMQKVGKAMGVGLGAAAGIVGGALAGAEGIAQTEREVRRVAVSGLSQDEKMALVQEIQLKAGGDASTIVDAINRAASVVRTSNPADLRRAAMAEMEFPGSAALFAASGAGANADDMVILQNRLRAIQSATGVNVGDLSGIADSVRNLGDRAFQSGASQQDIIALQAALQGSGAFDSAEEIEKAMRGFLAQAGLNRQNFYQKMQEHDWSRYVYRSQDKNQAETFRKSFDFKALESAANSAESTSIKQTAAEKAAETARKLTQQKDKLVQRILEKIMPMLESGKLDDIIDGLFKLFEAVEPILIPALEAVSAVLDVVNKLVGWLKPKIENIVDMLSRLPVIGRLANNDDDKKEPQALEAEPGVSGGSRAQGGLALSPTIVGERGAELILPLDYARLGRAQNIVNNVSQTFNMGASAPTALSLGNALRSRNFTDQLISSRMYGG